MRTIATLLLLTVLTTGCATGPSFSGVQPDQSDANTHANPVEVELAQGVSPDAQPDADKSRIGTKLTAAANRTGRVLKCAVRTGRVLKCAVMGAIGGVLLAPVAMHLMGATTVNPTAWSAFALLGMAGGAAMALKDDKKQPCG